MASQSQRIGLSTWRQRLASSLQLRSVPWLVLGSGLMITGVLIHGQRLINQVDYQRNERLLANQIAAAVSTQLSMTEAILEGVAGLFQSDRPIQDDHFSRFVATLKLRNPGLEGIQGIGFASFLPSISSTDQRPAAPKGVITFLQPADWRNQRAMGFNMLLDPIRRQAMEQSALSGEAALTGPVRLPQEAGESPQTGAVLVVPIYRGADAVFLSARDRWQRLQGWSFAPLRMGDLITSAVTTIDSPLKYDTRIVIDEASASRLNQRLYDNQSGIHQTQGNPITWVDVSVAHRPWRIGIQLGPRNGSPEGWNASLTLGLLFGLSLSGLLALLTQRLVANHLALGMALARERQDARERALAATVFESSPVGIVVTDASGLILRVNPAYTQISGYSQQEARGHKANLMRSGRHDDDFYRQMWESIVMRGHWNGEIWNRHSTGQIRRHELHINAVIDNNNQIVNFVGLVWDITERHANEERMHHLATHDQLTGLANRSLLMDLLRGSLTLAKRQGNRVGILFFDLNGFKAVNDTFGHSTGDALLIEVARRLQQKLRESDTLCRQGGDEFVLFIPHPPDLRELLNVSVKLHHALQQPFLDLPEGVSISVSIGAALWPEHARDAESLMEAADNAMYYAKQHRGEGEAIAVAPLVGEPGGPKLAREALPDWKGFSRPAHGTAGGAQR